MTLPRPRRVATSPTSQSQSDSTLSTSAKAATETRTRSSPSANSAVNLPPLFYQRTVGGVAYAWIRHFVPVFRGEGESAPEILPKNVSDDALIADLSQPNGVTCENRKHSFERGIIVLRFGGSYYMSPFAHLGGSVVNLLYERHFIVSLSL